MIKLFVSLPMNGLSDDEIRANMAEAKEAAERIIGQQVVLIDTLFDLPGGTHCLVYLGESLKKMAEANVVYFHKGWEKARGCLLEHMAASAYGMDIIRFGMKRR